MVVEKEARNRNSSPSLSLSVFLTLFLPVKQRKAKFTLDKELRAGRANRDFEPLCLESLTKIQIMRSQRWTRDKGIVRRPWLDISTGKRKQRNGRNARFFFSSSRFIACRTRCQLLETPLKEKRTKGSRVNGKGLCTSFPSHF